MRVDNLQVFNCRFGMLAGKCLRSNSTFYNLCHLPVRAEVSGGYQTSYSCQRLLELTAVSFGRNIFDVWFASKMLKIQIMRCFWVP